MNTLKIKTKTKTKKTFKKTLSKKIETATAIIVPFRDLEDSSKRRTTHLKEFEKYMKEYLKGYKYKIFIIDQSDDNKKFNRGKLLNIGLKHSKK